MRPSVKRTNVDIDKVVHTDTDSETETQTQTQTHYPAGYKLHGHLVIMVGASDPDKAFSSRKASHLVRGQRRGSTYES